MLKLVTAARMRELDRLTIEAVGVPGTVLMELAGHGAFTVIRDSGWLRAPDDAVLIVVGKGNNGGDALVVARWLWLADRRHQTVVLLTDPDTLAGDARGNLERYRNLGGVVRPVLTVDDWQVLKQELRSPAAVAVDGILGTGLSSPVRGLYAEVITDLPALARRVIALDIPSGLHADRGVPLGAAVRAHKTVTFGYGKTGLLGYPGREYAGEVTVIDIGIPADLVAEGPAVDWLEAADAPGLLPPELESGSHKGSRGHLLTVGGARGKAGAGIMAAAAGLKIGCGLSTLALPATVAAAIEGHRPEIMLVPLADDDAGRTAAAAGEDLQAALAGKHAVACGPGLGTHAAVIELLTTLIDGMEGRPLLLDADALTGIAKNPELLRRDRFGALILTPHPGEMGRLLGIGSDEVQQDRLRLAAEFAAEYNVYLVLKGAGTVIAAPDGRLAINGTGNSLLATAGSGDVLTGTIGGLLAGGMDPWRACGLGVVLHGMTADLLHARGRRCGITAMDILETLPDTAATARQGVEQ
ncbi:MAG: NAD(P)H-hydrate dehydratase [Deltaproteobacteria bacterium]|nr:NAD(P)H-hydrate dehydratase [Candidatus Anaeroferrophillacea bacterium]